MPHPTKTRKRKNRGDTLHPGICRHARLLGVNRVTLYRVLVGEWTHLSGLRARYDDLIASEGKEAA